MNIWNNRSAAWLIANTVLTCTSVADLGSPSKFVVGPFLYAKVISFYYNFLFTDLRWNKTHLLSVLCYLLLPNDLETYAASTKFES